MVIAIPLTVQPCVVFRKENVMASSKIGGLKEQPLTRSTTRSQESPAPTVEIVSFKEALLLAGEKNRHVLLGNGFSIALRPDIFTYNTLYERAKDSGRLTSEMQNVFDQLGTTDFEQVMEALQDAATLVRVYENSNPTLAAQLEKDATLLRDVLAETIAANHPARPHEVSPEQYESCRQFLSNFSGSIYTLNYDLLLYWTLMQRELEPAITSDDGFRDPDNREEEFVVWEVQNTNQQRIFYLHGALHIYDAGADLLKFTWRKTDTPLIVQIKRSLEDRRYPLIVTEGTTNQKVDRIQHSNFLGRAYRSFSQICDKPKSSLFIYGHSLAPNDEHLLKLIDKGKIGKIFVGIYGDSKSPNNMKIIERARLFGTRRDPTHPAEVHFFDASSAQVWDGQSFNS